MMGWLGIHWWRSLPDWGQRQCRLCGIKERSMYETATGQYWVEI